MEYSVNKLPDFYSVRNYEQIDYSLEGLEGKKCFAFFDNGFTSNIIEPNKRDIKFVWDGFLLFVDEDITLDDMKNGIDLYEGRLVALQRTSIIHQKSNTKEVREYIINKLEEKEIPIQIMPDSKDVDGYPSKADLWSTRDSDVLLDATECTGIGDAYYFNNSNFSYSIEFLISGIPTFNYKHRGAIVLKGENETAISRLILNIQGLQEKLESLVGEDKVFSYLENRSISGTSIENIENHFKK